MSTDSEFYKKFAANMQAMGLPAPQSLFGTLSTAMASTAAIAGAIAKVGSEATLAELLYTFPAAGGTAVLAGAIGEICAVGGALLASFYVGACIGSIVAAAIDVYGVKIIGTLTRWVSELTAVLDQDVAEFFDETLEDNPELAQVRTASDQLWAMS